MAHIKDAKGKDRSLGPQDVKPGWLMESAIRSLGPHIFYPNGVVTDRRTGDILWRPGDDPAKKPPPFDMGTSNKPHTTHRGL